ncbi:S9 family peptidase [Kineococcus aurantiacus]|uniref:Dipeptidyl aminopeptidase/acylaminoacyl peptidase n=1 Tax=Kineococcus aurantiacus TaxID=37633 RepID=A0A7Y9DQP7_9ACTN|nr:S9 family peptidase [Kineococcus aurantiacus]NYD24781.1 dipeptidyl aminopeptidase/acylaminoacyl peptidase [Kineococcus aurantiacus]
MSGETPDLPLDAALALADDLVEAWGSWRPTMTPDARRVAFVSDRSGVPQLWVQDVVLDGPAPQARRLHLSDDPVVSVSWAADSRWLACSVAAGGGVRTEVWVVRPDGSDARRIAGDAHEHAELGPWTRSGHRVVVTFPASGGRPARSFLGDPATGRLDPLAEGELIHVLDVSQEERFLVIVDGERGQQFAVVVDRLIDEHQLLLPHGATGSTDVALLRPAPAGDTGPVYVYLASDVGLPRRQLIGLPFGPNGYRGEAQTLAARDDAELEFVDGDDAGSLLLLVWNVAGASELELFDTTTRRRTRLHGLPGLVATDPVLSRDGRSVVLGVEGPTRPRELWHLDTATGTWTQITHAPELPDRDLVVPTLQTYRAHDGLPLTGWLYPAAEVPGGGGAAALWLHGGPEAQERPTFNPMVQALVAAGTTVFAPNVRGSSGFGREFVHADDREKRYDAFADVLSSAQHLVAQGLADPARIAVTGRSYGGYLTLAALAFSPGVFAAGVDICGMSDLTTFYRDTEPWIGAAAVSKYGHPEHDRTLLEEISPLRRADAIDVPLLVVHGELDTNVPLGEARQIVAALRGLDRDVDYLELPQEGHDYRRVGSRRELSRRVVAFLDAHLAAPALAVSGPR